MSALKIGVVEDELVIARTIIGTLHELGYTHCGPAINYTEAIDLLEHQKPDLLLLDIQLAGKKDGFDVAQQLNERYPMPFIFLTANSDAETIDQAKKVKPHAYIVKPFTKEELFAAIEIAFSNFANSFPAGKTAAPTALHDKDHLFVKDGHTYKKIYLHEILYLESDANYVSVHLQLQKKVMIRTTINALIEQINSKNFLRVHRSYSVNIEKIVHVHPSEIVLQGATVPIGKLYREELFKALGIRE
ncbi:two component transcriptional regulator, LytTR family [Filimonas lacunae]|uniref:Two component transcriptional regulator, LytTR family n=1 Tax=Filimonas lacunae TaxID=477680 RepID=A0A173MC63_9BACT|nr:response regulator [Filimonas lacunae]BAV05090.1 two-component hybrid sensor and regulator [Filimonas lacunae]SIT34241.1 two component transcriptional regulator, LytTR family [Filimonas lacunae]